MTFGTIAADPAAMPDIGRADFHELYEWLQPSLSRYAFRLVGDSDAAEDVVQEAFVRLVERTDLTGDDARLWLFTVVTNLIRDRGRTSSRRRRILEESPPEVHRPAQADAVLEQNERVAAVRAALAQLAERDRQMLMMREEGFSYQEIAEAGEVAPGSVGTLIARAVQRFAKVYNSVD